MEAFGVKQQQIEELRAFVGMLKQHPEFLNDERLSFLKEYIISLGGKIPEEKKEEEQKSFTVDDPEIMPADTLEPEDIIMDVEVTEQAEEDARAKRGEAAEAYNNGDYAKAIELITEAIKANPSVANFYANRGQYFIKQRKPNAAIRDCTTAIKLNPDNAKAYKVRGMAYRYLGKYEQAVVDLRLGNKLDYDDNTYEMQKTVEKFISQINNAKKTTEPPKPQPTHEEHHCNCQGPKPAGCDGHGGCGRQGGCGGMPNMGGCGGMPNMGGCGGMPNMGNIFSELSQDPELMAAMQDPDVMTKLTSAMSNPAMLASLMNDPKVGPILAKLMAKFSK